MSKVNIPELVDGLKTQFASQKTKDISFRKKQLAQLIEGIHEFEEEFAQAFKTDLGINNGSGNFLSQFVGQVPMIEHVLDNLDEYTKPRIKETTLALGNSVCKLVPQPLGTVLVIGAWNFPITTGILPVAEAIAAGNTVCLKPSELSPNLSSVIKKIFEKYLDDDCYKVVEGAADEVIELQQQRWDLVIFTGSPDKGKLVAQQAAKTLTPVILELGGKSPTIIDSDADLNMTAKKLTMSKLTNSGQICLAPDYLFVENSIKEAFLKEIVEQFEAQYTKNPKESPDYSRIVSQDFTTRLGELIETSGGEVIHGGTFNASERYVSPTIILNPEKESRLMQEEIFGPIFPVYTYQNLQEVIDFINQKEKPLALYYFGNNQDNIKKIEDQTYSGAFSTNQCLYHAINPYLPFGGVGHSGLGSLRGQYGFDQCSALKPVMYGDTYNGKLLDNAFPPFTKEKYQQSKKLMPWLLNQKLSSIKKGGAAVIGLPILGFLFAKLKSNN